MKLQELLESTVSFGSMQKVIYDYVLSKIKTDNSTLSEIKDQMSNDRFWVEEFDDLHKAVEREDFDEITDEIANTVDAIKTKIENHFGDSMNHAPGYKKPKMVLSDLDYNAVSSKDLAAIAEKITPGLIAKIKAEHKAASTAYKKQTQAAIKSITPERMEEIVKFVKKHDSSGWNEFLRVLKIDKHPNDYLPKDLQNKIEDIKKMTSSKPLKALFNSVEDMKYISTVYDNISNLRDIESSKDINVIGCLATLRTISRNKKLSSTLAAKIK